MPAVRQWFEGGCLGAPRVGDLALVEREEVADDTGDVPGDEGEGESYLLADAYSRDVRRPTA